MARASKETAVKTEGKRNVLEAQALAEISEEELYAKLNFGEILLEKAI